MSNGSPSSFNEQWALGTDHTVSSPPADGLAASQSILEALRKRRGLETAQWMNKLASEISLDQHKSSTTSQQELTALSPEELNEDELTRWLDKLFSQFDLLANQFNRTAQGTDLIVACTPPNTSIQAKTTETVNNNLIKKIYEGHLVTRFWAMLLRGTAGTINVYIIPAEVLLGFSLHKIDETVYSPLLVIESLWKDNELTWHIGGICISRNQIPLLAKELFGDLVRVASGQMDESELFAHPFQQLSLGENLAVGYKLLPCVAEQPTTQVLNLAKPAPTPGNDSKNARLTLTSLHLGKEMLTAIDADINLLFQLGKSALTSEDTSTFKKIELLTEKMETLKESFKKAFSEVTQASQERKEN